MKLEFIVHKSLPPANEILIRLATFIPYKDSQTKRWTNTLHEMKFILYACIRCSRCKSTDKFTTFQSNLESN